MQSSLRRYAEPKPAAGGSGKGTSAEPSGVQPKNKRKGSGSLLLAALGSQLVRGGSDCSGADTDSRARPGSVSTAGPQAADATPAAQAHAQARPLQELPTNVAVAPALPQKQAQGNLSSAGVAAARYQSSGNAGGGSSDSQLLACPLCGILLPAGAALEQHVQQELMQLEGEEGEEVWCEQSDEVAVAAAGRTVAAAGQRQWQQQGGQQWGQAVQEWQQAVQEWQQAGGARGAGPAPGPAQLPHQQHQQQQYQQRPGSLPAWQQQQDCQLGSRGQQQWPTSQQQQHRPTLQQQQQHVPQPAPSRRQQAGVLVLGGAPQVTAPTDRRRLQQLRSQHLLRAKRQRQQQASAAAGFNFYADGSGTWAGEDIGLDGAENVGLRWEGMGTSDF